MGPAATPTTPRPRANAWRSGASTAMVFRRSTTWASHFESFGRVLDVGCGGGLSSGVWLTSPGWTGAAMWVGVDLSTAVDVARTRLGATPNTHFVQADALELPFADGTFGAVFSEGVLHHTPSTRVGARCPRRACWRPGGEMSFYVYRKKGPAREFTDDFVRDAIKGLSDEEAWEVMRGFTRLGQALARLRATVDVPEAVPLLGHRGRAAGHAAADLLEFRQALSGTTTLSFEENVHVNFDWFRPTYAHRQTAAEVREWCDEAALDDPSVQRAGKRLHRDREEALAHVRHRRHRAIRRRPGGARGPRAHVRCPAPSGPGRRWRLDGRARWGSAIAGSRSSTCRRRRRSR